MGGAIATRVVQSGLYAPDRVVVSEPDDGARKRLAAKAKEAGGPVVLNDNGKAVEGATTVLLAVIPQAVASVAESLRDHLRPNQLVISIAAGVELQTLRSALRHEAVIRVMPNTPAQVGAGVSAWFAAEAVSAGQKADARAILQAVGREIEVDRERVIDMVTALSGSGPA